MAAEQERDEQGRWTSGGGGGAKRDASEWAKRLAGPLSSKATKEGGFTYRPGAPRADRVPTDGFMVSRAPSENQGHVVEMAKMAKEAGEKAAGRNPPPSADELRAEVSAKVKESVKKDVTAWLEKSIPSIQKMGSDHYLGGWYETDDKGAAVALHLDVSQRFDPRHKDQALKAGRERNQMAIWDVGGKQEIQTGGTGR